MGWYISGLPATATYAVGQELYMVGRRSGCVIAHMSGHLSGVWVQSGWVLWAKGPLCCTPSGGAPKCPLVLYLRKRFKASSGNWETLR